MPSQRIQRVESLLRSEIGNLIQRKIKDPRIGLVSVTRVDAAPDLHEARVFVSIYGDQAAHTNALAGLQSAAGFIRSELMKALHLRPIPALEFRSDDALERAAHTLDLLDQIRHEHEDTNPDPKAGDRPHSEE